jgi:ankyrin repeat protein
LYYSSLCGFSDLVEQLALKYPQRVNAIGGFWESPLFAALHGKYKPIAEILLKHGAKLDIRGTRQQPPIPFTDIDMLRFLLDHGADVNFRQDDLGTPLHLAASYRALDIAQMLLEHKADVNSQDRNGKTPLHLLSESWLRSRPEGQFRRRIVFVNSGPNPKLVHLFLEHGAEVNFRMTNNWTPLHSTAFTGKVETVRLLLDHGADTTVETNRGEHLVSRSKYGSQELGVNIARLLLEHGADVNARTKGKAMPLHLAISGG